MGQLMEGFETFTPAERAYLDGKGEAIPTGDEMPVDEAGETETEDVDAVESEDVDPEVEAKDEAPEEEEKPKRKDQRIPLRKLQESENQRRELEKKLAEREQAFARADERLKTLMALAQQPQEQAKENLPPDPKDDPIGAIEWQKARLEQLEAERQRQIEEYQRQSQVAQLDNAYKSDWNAFISKTPDAIDAYNHFVGVTSAFLDMQGVPQEQINALVENEERKIAFAAMQRGVSPAQVIYEKARQMGYAPKAAEQPAVDERRKAEDDIARRQKAAPASKSLSAAGGSRGGSMPTMEELANMPEEEFAEFRSKIGERQFRKLMGE